MSEHLAVVLISNTEPHLMLIVFEHTGKSLLAKPIGECRVIYCSVTMALVLLCVSFSSVSNMAGCRKCLCDNFEGISNLEHKSKYVKVHGVIVPLSPVKDNASHLFSRLNSNHIIRENRNKIVSLSHASKNSKPYHICHLRWAVYQYIVVWQYCIDTIPVYICTFVILETRYRLYREITI